jgi:hypothetical protein
VSTTFECITPLLPTFLRNEVNPFFTQATFQWSNLLGGKDLPILKSVQGAWDIPLCKKRFETLLQSAITDEDKARLRVVSSEHASDWLNCVPLPSMSLKLNRQSFELLLLYASDPRSADLTSAIVSTKIQDSQIQWTSKVFMVSVVQVQAEKGELQGTTVQTI